VEHIWRDINTVPKGATVESPMREYWVLGINSIGEQRVIRWYMEYPYIDGVWMYASAPTDYMDKIIEFKPVKWMPLPSINHELHNVATNQEALPMKEYTVNYTSSIDDPYVKTFTTQARSTNEALENAYDEREIWSVWLVGSHAIVDNETGGIS
jgi:hypothetical protein